MATLLYRLGRFSARRRWTVLVCWAAVLAVLGALALGLTRTASPDSAFSVPGTQAGAGLDVVRQKFSGGADRATATVVFQAPQGSTLTGQDAASVQGLLGGLRSIDGVASVTDPFDARQPYVSRDGRIAASTVTFRSTAGGVPETTRRSFAKATGSDVGPVRLEVTSSLTVPDVSAASEAIGLAVAFVVLLLTYGALAAAGANLLTAGVGVGAGLLGIAALGQVVSLSSTTPALAAMLGLAVGIDYSLLIFARTRAELRAGAGVPDAVATATATAGTVVVVAGATVIVALVGLAVVDIPFLTEMGLAAAATVAVTVVAALTAVPAVLSLLGRRVLPTPERGVRPATDGHSPTADTAATTRPDHAREGAENSAARRGVVGRWATTVTRHPVPSLIVAVIALAVLAIPAASLHTALPSAENDGPATSSRQAYDLLVQGFGPGSQASLVVVVDTGRGAGPGTASTATTAVSARLAGLDDVAAVQPPIPSPDGTAALITVIPRSGPTDPATAELVSAIRAATAGTADADVLVTGTTALDVDVNTALADALPLYVGVIVALALVLLVLLFRSVAVPVLATLGFLLSLGASLGAMVAIYQWGWLAPVFGVAQPSPIISFIPVILVGILFGLAMDYQAFLVSAIREAGSGGVPARRAVVVGFGRAAGVVIAAAAIMSGVFGGFAFSGDPIIGSIGTALIVGVLADALVVRMVVMPAALTLLGPAAWWMPRWMHRVVPHVDAEGRSVQSSSAVEIGASVGVGSASPGGRVP